MSERDLGRRIDPTPRPFPERLVHAGRAVRLEPLSEAHLPALWSCAQGADDSFAYLRYGPFANIDTLRAQVVDLAGRADQPFWAVMPEPSGEAAGWLSLCDVYPADASIEIGSVWFSPRLQRTRAATEAVALLICHAFDDLGYRRLVWRCQAENAPSRRAAERFGFVLEGIWRAAAVVRGYERGVAWHSILAAEWPERRSAIMQWLDDSNFDANGRALSSLRRV